MENLRLNEMVEKNQKLVAMLRISFDS